METIDFSVKNKLGEVYYSFSFDEENGWIYSEWKGDVTADEVIEACKAGIDYIEEKKPEKILNDNSQLTGPWDEANEWIAQNWMPRALAAGLKKFAHVISPDVFGALSAEELITKVSGFEMRIFEDEEEAKSWLRS
ncbi:MAG: STAS/SEC14 domain-containing protein [Bacteroidota bacterium]